MVAVQGCAHPRSRTSVIDTRTTKEGLIRRRRYCDACGDRLTTYEVPEAYLADLLETKQRLKQFLNTRESMGKALGLLDAR